MWVDNVVLLEFIQWFSFHCLGAWSFQVTEQARKLCEHIAVPGGRMLVHLMQFSGVMHAHAR